MSINIIENGISSLIRYIQIGGNNYTDAIQRDFNLKYEDADLVKKGKQLPNVNPKAVSNILRQISSDLVSDIQRSFDFYRSSSSNEKIDKIYVSGGCAKIKGLVPFMSNKLQVPVEMMNPFKNIEVAERVFNIEELQDKAPQAAIATGLALRKVGD